MDADLEKAYNALRAKKRDLDRYFSYYDGEEQTPVVSERLREVYQNIDFSINENWAAVVIDSMADRINLEGVKGPNQEVQDAIDEALQLTDLLIEADDAHEAALIAGEAYLLAWKEDDGDVECYYHDPRMCHVFYDEASPNRATFAAKWWEDDTRCHIKLFHADRIVHYAANRTASGEFADSDVFTKIDEAEHDYGVVPVFHLRPRRRKAISELRSVIPIQDGINLMLTNMFVTGEFSAAPMKYVISNAEGLEDLVSAPNRIWTIPSAGGLDGGSSPQVGQFGAADLGNYLKAVEHSINALSSITRTPKHYFDLGQNAPSGEALKVMEAPLVKKCRERIARFEPTWRRLIVFLCKLQGVEVAERDITIQWSSSETVQPAQEAATEKARADAVAAKKEIGISVRQALRELGYTDEQIDQMGDERADEPAPDGATGNALMQALSKGAPSAPAKKLAKPSPATPGRLPSSAGDTGGANGASGASEPAEAHAEEVV
ncbi:phage portal protein [Oscillochloris sp. ZM17-4]|uniref:phage portal protein n=1 Tax=Oscillochloris sp. ZM17-4 TaxID=2866714 RepID=UPI001C72DF9E|nr:phage portal protein [Oscillochloris sp. ZM17-4]MBX0328690.1 phage portal protein [Oscillochloris sp. ZM17-4]